MKGRPIARRASLNSSNALSSGLVASSSASGTFGRAGCFWVEACTRKFTLFSLNQCALRVLSEE
jgi:hypothetical protein